MCVPCMFHAKSEISAAAKPIDYIISHKYTYFLYTVEKKSKTSLSSGKMHLSEFEKNSVNR